MNITDELKLATHNNREAYSKLILNADSIIGFIDAMAENEDKDNFEHYQRLARHLMIVLSK